MLPEKIILIDKDKDLVKAWEEVFEEMHTAGLAIIYKKGATDNPANYRPIALLNLSYRILAKMIQVRLLKGLDDCLDNQQFGFRKAKSTSQPICIYWRILENSKIDR